MILFLCTHGSSRLRCPQLHLFGSSGNPVGGRNQGSECNDDCRRIPASSHGASSAGGRMTRRVSGGDARPLCGTAKRRQSDTSPTNPQRGLRLPALRAVKLPPIDATRSTGCIPPALCAVRFAPDLQNARVGLTCRRRRAAAGIRSAITPLESRKSQNGINRREPGGMVRAAV